MEKWFYAVGLAVVLVPVIVALNRNRLRLNVRRNKLSEPERIAQDKEDWWDRQY